MHKMFIFLDIDGVLNNINNSIKSTLKYNTPYHNGNLMFDEQNIEVLKYILSLMEECNLEPIIVLSSTWRLNKDDIDIFSKMCEQHNISFNKNNITSNLNNRGLEIKEFMDNIKKDNTSVYFKDNYLIIDDDINSFSKEQLQNLIRCFTSYGLTYYVAKDVIKKLKNQIKEREKK